MEIPDHADVGVDHILTFCFRRLKTAGREDFVGGKVEAFNGDLSVASFVDRRPGRQSINGFSALGDDEAPPPQAKKPWFAATSPNFPIANQWLCSFREKWMGQWADTFWNLVPGLISKKVISATAFAWCSNQWKHFKGHLPFRTCDYCTWIWNYPVQSP